jgi:hypothetical protein
MKQQFDRYFELFPLIAIILILVAREHREQRPVFEPTVVDYSMPSLEVQAPRLIFR